MLPDPLVKNFDKLVDGGASSPATATPTQVLLESYGLRPQNL